MTRHTRAQSILAVQYLHVIVALRYCHTTVIGRRIRLTIAVNGLRQRKSNQQHGHWRPHVVLHPMINQNNQHRL